MPHVHASEPYQAMLWKLWYVFYQGKILASDWSKKDNCGIMLQRADIYILEHCRTFAKSYFKCWDCLFWIFLLKVFQNLSVVTATNLYRICKSCGFRRRYVSVLKFSIRCGSSEINNKMTIATIWNMFFHIWLFQMFWHFLKGDNAV